MTIWRNALLGVAAAGLLTVGTAQAAGNDDGQVTIGVLGDMSGVYADGFSGPGATAAVKMAVKDFGGSVLGKDIEVISADHQNKADIASSTAREWIDRDNVDVIMDLTNSAVGLAVQQLASNKGIITINTGSATSALTNDACTAYGIHYGYDTHALPVGTATAIVKNGGKKWFFITADYAFGQALESNTSDVVKELGGSVVGSVRAPLNTNDFSSYLLQAQSSGADVIGLANAGTDTINAVKQANEFGIVSRGQSLAGMLVLISDVKSLGLDTAKGLQFTSGWYWDHDEDSRQWAKRYLASGGTTPTFPHAALYSATMAYLNAVNAAGTDESDAVRKAIGNKPIDDFFAQGGTIRDDGLLEHDMYLLKVKGPDASKGEWDVATVERTIPGDQAYPSLAESGCARLK
ncbi:ABC transporter substrate binding protein Branched chain amino acid [Salinisphaera shabanensis E1L3A]|uniref:ABC transporter substrate binding protein Branched chain amino acid n=1 Tax=Salinisphaera shabanensis E1L3A TaxID=1033802 RepID=U2FVW1_9GAMM|nr:ABC transporter substrate-binding protein [Salinisphaera shabanensis]ERJ20029.1 ABC transporter substrate binding protein Branched chain amino acid [Salinisphaera shabanensis E1L3A]